MTDPQVQRFPVTGMTCAACARRVERALVAVPGVRSARVDALLEQAQVEAPGVAPATLAAAVAAAGYALILSPPPTHAPSLDAPFWPIGLGMLATAPLLAPMLGLPLHLDWRVQGVVAVLVVVGLGQGFIRRAAVQARHGSTSMDTLIALGALMGLALGLMDGLRGQPHSPFEISASLVVFLRFGRWLEAHARHRALGSIADLLTLAPDQAERIAADGTTTLVAVATLVPGDRVRIRPGNAIPADGVVSAGASEVFEALITGEPLPVARTVGDRVLAGAVVYGGSLDVTVSSVGAQTWLAELARQVTTAIGARPPAQELADRISAVFVPVILVLAILTGVAWGVLGHDWMVATRIAITVLVVACPCALGLATPVAMAVALGTAARHGVVVSDQRALDALGRATDLVLDKTGTLTRGHPQVQAVLVLGDLDEPRLRAIAAALEATSEHPVAKALRSSGSTLPVTGWRAQAGGGVVGTIDGVEYRLGSLAWTGLSGVSVPDDAIAVGLVRGSTPLAVFLLADALRPEAAGLLATAAGDGLTLHLLSGDRQTAVTHMAMGLPFATATGGLDPAAKAAWIRAQQAQGRVVAFAGDGVNDAVALAVADAGISLPGLSATAAAAGLNLRREGLQPLFDLRRQAQRLRAVVRQNLAWAFGYNLVLVPLAACGVLDRVGGPVLAGAAMALSSLCVVVNALRLRR